MLKNNNQLFNLYVGYADGSFIEMDALDGAGRDGRARLEAPEQAAFRLVVISQVGSCPCEIEKAISVRRLETIRELPGPARL